jgi:hypothetical protein
VCSLGCDINIIDLTLGNRDSDSVFAHAFNVQNYRFADAVLDFCDGLAGCDTARQIRNVCGEIAVSFLNYDCISHVYFQPACLKMLFWVPGASSSLGFPETVTRPGFDGCLNWRWLPLVVARYQPSAFSLASTSETFIGMQNRVLGA